MASGTGVRMASGIKALDLGSLLSELRPFVPRSLIDDPRWDRLATRVGELPGWAVASRSLGFEFRLGDPVAAADVFVWLGSHSLVWDYYVRKAQAVGPDSPHAVLGRLFAHATDPATSLDPSGANRLASVFVEYDIAEVPPEEWPAPGVFVGAAPRDGSSHRPERQALDDLLMAAGWADDSGLRRSVAHVLGALPLDSAVRNLGVMPGRERKAMRLIVSRVEADQVPALLEELGWPGPLPQLKEVLADTADLRDSFMLDVDVAADGLLPRLGLELFPEHRPGDPDSWLCTARPDWLTLVQHLEARKLCRPEKAAGLLAFPGRDQLFDVAGVFTLYRGINHIKLVMDNDRPLHAKAYAALRFLEFA